MANKRFLLACAASAALVPAGPAAGFGPAGHLIAAALAEPRLCAAARVEVDLLGAGASLGELGLWADTIRGEPRWQHSAPWHYVNIDDPPRGVNTLTAVRAYRHPPEGDVLAAIERFRTELGNRALPARTRREALRFLAHFVVDVHQPLHVGRAEDRGGNAIDVRYGETVVNLHRFWDTDVIALAGLAPPSYARRLATRFASVAGVENQSEPADWAAESLTLRVVVYGFGAPADAGAGPIPLGDDYLAAAQRVIDERLVRAAARLAATLNGVFCASGPR